MAVRRFLALGLTASVSTLAACGSGPVVPESLTPTDPAPPTASASSYRVAEFPIDYPAAPPPATPTTHAHGGSAGPHLNEHNGATTVGSTHEITFDRSAARPTALWITDQQSASLVKMSLDGTYELMAMPAGSGPHGSAFDQRGQLWVTLEFLHQVVRVDGEGVIQQRVDLTQACATCDDPDRLPGPHGLAAGPDGKTMWFAAKEGGYIGAVRPGGKATAYPLPDPKALPIYLSAGPDGNMWFTELAANKIGRITPQGTITEFDIPSPGSRPIAIRPGPDGAMWFTEEATNKIGRISVDDGSITEFEVPKSQPNLILAGLDFDADGNLWVQQYVNQAQPDPAGPDTVLRIARSFVNQPVSPVPAAAVTAIEVPSRRTVMHRVIAGPDQNIWFTELNLNTVGRISR